MLTKPISPIVVLPLDEALPDPQNTNDHPEENITAIMGSLIEFGQMIPIVLSPNKIIRKGNGTREAMMRLRERVRAGDASAKGVNGETWETVECIISSVLSSNHKAAGFSITDNITSTLSKMNPEKTAKIIAAMKADGYDLEKKGVGIDSSRIQNILKSQWKPEKEEAEKEPESESEMGLEASDDIYEMVDGVIFSSDNEWEIPNLDLDGMADESCIPEQTWVHGMKLQPDMLFVYKADGKGFWPKVRRGVMCFYTEDVQFEEVWTQAVDIVKALKMADFKAIVAPDYSTYSNDPAAVQLYNIYRTRWTARYWQKAGIKIIPSLTLYSQRMAKYANVGIPRGTPVVATQAQTGFASKNKEQARKEFIRHINLAIEEIGMQHVIIYGSNHRSKLEPYLPTGVQYHWFQSWKSLRTKVYQASKN